MKSEIFDGGGSFENLFWTGQDVSREAPKGTTDQRMEITEGADKKKEEEEKKRKDGFVLSQEGEAAEL
jgi:hypothetical protein